MYESRKQEFLDLFYNKVFPYIAQSEKDRLLTWAVIIIDMTLILGGGIFWTIKEFILPNIRNFDIFNHGIACFIILCFAFIISTSIARAFKDGFIRKLKEKHMTNIVSFFNGMKWIKLGCFADPLEFSDLPVLSKETFNDASCDDEFTGEYKNIPYCLKETLLKYISGSGKHRTETTVFKGIVLEFTPNKTIPAGFGITSKGITLAPKALFSEVFKLLFMLLVFVAVTFFSIYLIEPFTQNPLYTNPVVLFDGAICLILFLCIVVTIKDHQKNHKILKNNRNLLNIESYDVTTPQNISGNELFKPELLEILDKTRRIFKANGISLNTYDSSEGIKVVLIIPTKINAFEFGSLYKPLNKPASMDAFFDQLSCIMDLIDYFSTL